MSRLLRNSITLLQHKGWAAAVRYVWKARKAA